MANENAGQHRRPAQAGLNPWGPAPYSLAYAIFLLTIITISNFFWGKNDGSTLYKFYTGFMAFTLICAICIFSIDSTLFIIRSPQRRDDLVWYRDRVLWISVPAASIGFALFSFYKAKDNLFGSIVTGIISGILAIAQFAMAIQIRNDIRAPPVEEEATEEGGNTELAA